MPEFVSGSEHIAHVPFANPTTVGFDYDAILYMGTNWVVMATASFHLYAGGSKNIDLPVTMPSDAGTYPVYIAVSSGGKDIVLYQATEDVTITSGYIPPEAPIGFVSLEPSEFNWSYVLNYPPLSTYLYGARGAITPRLLYKPEAAYHAYRLIMYFAIPPSSPYYNPDAPYCSLMDTYRALQVVPDIEALPPDWLPHEVINGEYYSVTDQGLEFRFIVEPGEHDNPSMRLGNYSCCYSQIAPLGPTNQPISYDGRIPGTSFNVKTFPQALWGEYPVLLAVQQATFTVGVDSNGYLEFLYMSPGELIVRDVAIGTVRIDV